MKNISYLNFLYKMNMINDIPNKKYLINNIQRYRQNMYLLYRMYIYDKRRGKVNKPNY